MYYVNFAMMQHHNYSLSELENMIVWEREIYIKMLIDHLENLHKEQKEQLQNAGR